MGQSASRELAVPRDSGEVINEPHWEGPCSNAGRLNFILGIIEK